MKATFCILIFALIAPCTRAQTNLTQLLQQGMLEEQANHNINAAIADYEALSTQFNKDRQLAATAIFRLGECYREEGQTNQAALEYRRILNEFPDQKNLVTLSQEDLAGMGATPPAAEATPENSVAPPSPNSLIPEIWNRVRRLSPAELEKVLPTLVPDPMLTSLLQQRNAAETELARKRTYLGEQNSDVVAEKAQLSTINQQITNRVSGIMEALKVQYDAAVMASSFGTPAQPSAPPSEEDQEIARLQAMLQNSPDLINAAQTDGLPPLVIAASSDHLRVAQFLLDHNADVNVQSRDGTPLVAAAANGHKAMVELLLSRGADTEARDTAFDQTALYRAVSRGFEAVTKTLIAGHADVNAQDNEGYTPLFVAVQSPDTKIAKMLLAAGANANITNNAGVTPLSYAGRHILAHNAVKLLLAARADPNGGTCDAPLLSAIDNSDASSAEMLLQAGANPNLKSSVGQLQNVTRDGYNHTIPLWAAISRNDVPMVQLLLKYKADPNDAQINNTPVIFSAVDKTNILQTLLDAGANANITNSDSRTPLRVAADVGSLDAVKLLLAAKADPNRDLQYPPLIRAVSRNYPEIVDVLLRAGADPNVHNTHPDTEGEYGGPIIFGALSHTNILQSLLDAGANPNVADNKGRTPLTFAAQDASPVAVRLLLAAKADPNAGTMDAPLLFAVDRQDLASAELLLQAGANPNVDCLMHCQEGLYGARWYSDYSANLRQATPLWLAIQNHQLPMVQLLLKYKANPNAQTGEPPAAIFWAFSNTNILQALLDGGANPNVRNHDGKTPLALAEEMESGITYVGSDSFPPPDQQKTIAASIADLLRQHGALEVLPDWDYITISRPSTKYSKGIFRDETNGWNQFTLMELLFRAYYGPSRLPFPDFAHITIARSAATGETSKRIPINLLNSTNGVDCSQDVPLEFGDVVEVPEREHTLAEYDTQRDRLIGEIVSCLRDKAGTAKLIVDGGQTIQLPLVGFEPVDCSVHELLSDNLARSVLTSDSDLSRVKVTRGDKTWTVDCNQNHDYTDLWVRNGDVIEVPEAR